MEATRKQLWALYCITKEDWRGKGLTKEEASKLIAEKSTMRENFNVEKILNEAMEEGNKRMKACRPTPMIVVEHENMADDNSEVKKMYPVPSGPCGFAWVELRANTPINRKFINGCRRLGVIANSIEERNDETIFIHSGRGYSHWTRNAGQSLQLKEAYADGFADVLIKYGIEVRVMSRMD